MPKSSRKRVVRLRKPYHSEATSKSFSRPSRTKAKFGSDLRMYSAKRLRSSGVSVGMVEVMRRNVAANPRAAVLDDLLPIHVQPFGTLRSGNGWTTTLVA